MEILVWAGTALSLLGLAGLVWSIVKVISARKRLAGDDEALRGAVQQVLPYNLGALFMSVLGLMLVIVGIFLT